MATIGVTSQPNDGHWESRQDNQAAMSFTMPEDGIITRLGQWIAGVSSSGTMRLCIWAGDVMDGSNPVLAQTALITVASRSEAQGNTDRYEADLTTPLQLDDGDVFYCGFSYNPAKDYQLDGDTAHTPGTHVHDQKATWPGAMDSVTTGNHGFGNFGMGSYVANYDEVSSGWVYRSGVWTRATAIQVRRSSAWVDVNGIQVYRSGAWVDAT